MSTHVLTNLHGRNKLINTTYVSSQPNNNTMLESINSSLQQQVKDENLKRNTLEIKINNIASEIELIQSELKSNSTITNSEILSKIDNLFLYFFENKSDNAYLDANNDIQIMY